MDKKAGNIKRELKKVADPEDVEKAREKYLKRVGATL